MGSPLLLSLVLFPVHCTRRSNPTTSAHTHIRRPKASVFWMNSDSRLSFVSIEVHTCGKRIISDMNIPSINFRALSVEITSIIISIVVSGSNVDVFFFYVWNNLLYEIDKSCAQSKEFYVIRVRQFWSFDPYEEMQTPWRLWESLKCVFFCSLVTVLAVI